MSREKINIETINFIQLDQKRLKKIKNLITDKILRNKTYNQSESIIEEQYQHIQELKQEIFLISKKENSGFRKSMSELFDSFYSIS